MTGRGSVLRGVDSFVEGFRQPLCQGQLLAASLAR